MDTAENRRFWQGRWQSGDTPWDHGEAAPPLREFLRTHPLDGRVLVPGCGSGHDVRYLAEQGLEATGMDISAAALETAREKNPHPRAGYLEGDFLADKPVPCGPWDGIFEHTCFCALHPALRETYVRSIVRNLRPGGWFLAIFYLRPAAEEGPPFGVSPDEVDRLFATLRLEEKFIPSSAWPSRTGREEVRFYRKQGD